MALTVTTRSDVFPVGASVGAWPITARHHQGVKPSGTALATATVASGGALSFPTLPAGQYTLWAEVAGASTNLMAGSEDFTPPGSLRERIAARRAVVGA